MKDYTKNYQIDYLEKTLIILLVFIALSYIISASHIGIEHYSKHIASSDIWRSADVYGHILGFMQTKDFTAFDRFVAGSKVTFDIPIYQFIIAKIAIFVKGDPLVIARFINALSWAITAYCGYKLILLLGGNALASLCFLFLLTTTRMLYVYANLLPDTMAVALSIAAILLLQKKRRAGAILYASMLLIIATLIKPPIPFVFIIFYTVYLILNNVFIKKSHINYLPYITLLTMLFLVAFATEQIRIILTEGHDGLWARNPKWYFGTLEQILSYNFWKIVVLHLRYLFSSDLFFLIISIIFIIANTIKYEKQHLFITLSALVAFFAGWLVFSNVYVIHLYYQLPVMIILLLSSAISISYLVTYISNKTAAINYQKIYKIILLLLIIVTVILSPNSFNEKKPASKCLPRN